MIVKILSMLLKLFQEQESYPLNRQKPRKRNNLKERKHSITETSQTKPWIVLINII